MLNKSTNYINLISIFLLIYLAFFPISPKNSTLNDIIDDNFYLENVYNHVLAMSKKPHYVGSENHKKVKKYIIKQLQKMGLSVKTQKTTISNDDRNFTQVENIIAKIEGSDSDRKALVLMSHYDSVEFDSLGAADAASGVAVVLEGVRAFIRQNTQPKNDIIVLITDAEEIGLLGAKAFVNKHPWSDNVGAILNFEARGSSGSSYLLMETNHGNRQMVNMINESQLAYPASNSLTYSIYKMLPNDTDLTVFREDKDIPGFNFAFIDDHFNYHTVLDNVENLSLDSLAHHAHHLMPLLKTLSQVDLNQLKAQADDVYIQIPFLQTFSYPFDWTLIISIISLVALIGVIVIGIKNHSLKMPEIFSAGFVLIKSVFFTGLISFLLLLFIYWSHPHYEEVIQGFTYNGHIYIALFSLLAVSICFYFYRKIAESFNASNIMVAPIALWILISIAIALTLPGAHFFVIIGILGTLSLAINVWKKKPQPTLTLLIMAPTVLIFTPIVTQLPIALGLGILPFNGILITLILACFIVSTQIHKQYHINQWIFILALIATYAYAETQSSISTQRPLPTSVFYYQSDEVKENGYLFTYDLTLNDWNKNLFAENRLTGDELENFRSNHRPWAQIVSKIDNKNITAAQIETVNQRQYSDKKIHTIKITTQRPVHHININTNSDTTVYDLTINKHNIISNTKGQLIKAQRKMVRIYTAGLYEFIIDIETPPEQKLDLDFVEVSHDLLSSKAFNIPPRTENFIPKPFYKTDSMIIKQHIIL